MAKGNCTHGEFDLAEGCPQCIEEHRRVEAVDRLDAANGPPVSIVKVRFFEDNDELSGREYTYFTAEPLAVGDVVQAPVRNGIRRSKVTAVNVDETEIAAFRDKVKTIPSGSIRPDPSVPTNQESVEIESPLAAAAQEAGAEVTVVNMFDQKPEPSEGEHVEQLWDEQKAVEQGVQSRPVALTVIETHVKKPTTELFQLYQEAASLLQFAKDRVITTNEDLKPATDDLAIIAKCKKAMFARKTEFVGPLKASLDLVNQAFGDLMFPVLEADRLTRGKVTEFDNEQRKRAAAAKRIEDEKFKLSREEAALNQGEYTVDLGTAQAPPPVPERVHTDMGTLGGRDNWKARVVDFKLLDDQWKLPNESLLNSHARTTKGERPIPGVEFYNDRTTTIRTK